MPSGISSFFSGQTGARGSIPSSGIENYIKPSTTGRSASPYSALSELMKMRALMTYMQDPTGSGLRPSSIDGFRLSGGTKLTAKERQALLDQAHMQQAQNAIYNNEEFRQRYQTAMQSSAAKAQQAVKDMREAYIKPTAAQFGVDAGKLSDIMMGQLSAETKQRVRDVKEDTLSYAGQKALHGLTNFFTTTLGNAIPFFRTEAERDAASKRAIEESRAIDQNNAYGRDQLLRQQEGEGFLDLGSGETGSYLANMAGMVGENLPAIATTIASAAASGPVGGALRLGAAGLNALRTGALMGAGAGVGAAMSKEGFRQRVFSDPNLSPEQQRAVLDSPEATANTALGAALGGIPFGVEGLWRIAAPRIPFTAAGRRVAADTAAQAAELTAARAAVPLAEREAVLDAGRRAALEAEAQRQAYQTMAPTFLSRAGQQARWMVPEVAAMNAGLTAGSNILYGGATGQDVPWTEGLGEAVASSIPLGLLGAGMSAASMGGRARTNFLRNFRDDGTPKITNAQLARTLNSRINNGTLGDVGTLDALRRFRADWGDEASFADVLAQVDPQYHDMLGKVYNLLGKSDITAKDIAAAFGRRETPEAPIIDTGAPIEQGSPVIQTGTPIEQRPQLPVGTGRAAQDVVFADEAPRGFREERVRQRPEPEPTVINARTIEYPDGEFDLIAEAPEGYVQESLPVMRDGLPGGPDTALPPRYEGPIPAGPAPRVYPLGARTAWTMLPEGSGAIVAESRSTGIGPVVAQRGRFTTLPEPVGDGAGSFTVHAAERAYDEGTTPRNHRAQQEQTAVANMRSRANQLTPLGQRILDYARTGDPSITAGGILDALIRDGRLEYGYEPRRIAAAYKEVMGILDDLSNKNNHPRLRTYTTMKPSDRALWINIRNRMRSSRTTKKATADSPSRYRDEISLDILQAMRNTLNEPESPARRSRTQGVGRNVTRGEAAGDAGDTATSGAVAPVARDADTQTAEPAAPADTATSRTNESGRPGGAEAPDVRAGEVAVPAAEPDGTQPVGTRTDGGRGAESAAEGTPAAGESAGVAPAERSRSENIQQPAQSTGNGKAVKAKGAKQPAKPRGRRATSEDSARVGEQVRQQVEADPALVPPANRVDEPAASLAETPKAPEIPALSEGPLITREEFPAVQKYINELPMDRLEQLALIVDKSDNKTGLEKNSFYYLLKNTPDRADVFRDMLIMDANTSNPRNPATRELHGILKDFIEGKITPPEAPSAPAASEKTRSKTRSSKGRKKAEAGSGQKKKQEKPAVPPKNSEEAAIDAAVEKLLNLKNKALKQHEQDMVRSEAKETVALENTEYVEKQTSAQSEERTRPARITDEDRKVMIDNIRVMNPEDLRKIAVRVDPFITDSGDYKFTYLLDVAYGGSNMVKDHLYELAADSYGTYKRHEETNKLNTKLSREDFDKIQRIIKNVVDSRPATIVPLSDVYDILTNAHSSEGLTPAKVRSAVEKDLSALYDFYISGKEYLSKKKLAQYEEVSKLLPKNTFIDPDTMDRAVAYQISAENQKMKVSGGKALLHELGLYKPTKDILDTKPTTVCR